jgi:hypothetical protein
MSPPPFATTAGPEAGSGTVSVVDAAPVEVLITYRLLFAELIAYSTVAGKAPLVGLKAILTTLSGMPVSPITVCVPVPGL